MQEIWSMLPDLKGSEDALDNMKADTFNTSNKSWFFICMAWDLILEQFDGGSLMLVNTIIGEAQEEVLGSFCSKVLDMTLASEYTADPIYSGMEAYDLHKMVPLVLTIYGEDRYERIIQLAKSDKHREVLRMWASTAKLIDWDKVDAFYEES